MVMRYIDELSDISLKICIFLLLSLVTISLIQQEPLRSDPAEDQGDGRRLELAREQRFDRRARERSCHSHQTATYENSHDRTRSRAPVRLRAHPAARLSRQYAEGAGRRRKAFARGLSRDRAQTRRRERKHHHRSLSDLAVPAHTKATTSGRYAFT